MEKTKKVNRQNPSVGYTMTGFIFVLICKKLIWRVSRKKRY
ncbi:MAG: hypothetical protein ACE5J0_00010 [Candidatus Paceibacterales bacterium]